MNKAIKIEKKKNRQSNRSMSIRWKLAIYIALFLAIVLLITWLFQLFLLHVFFRAVKKSEMKEAASNLIEKIGKDDLRLSAYSTAVNHSLCVVIYKIDDDRFSQVVNVDATGSNVVMSLDANRIRDFYSRAEKNKGECFAKIAFGGYEVDSDVEILFDKLEVYDENGKVIRIPSRNIRMIYIRVAQTSPEDRYMIVMDASMYPLKSTVQTLSVQYIWITIILSIVAGCMVVFLYRKISKPLISMTDSAKLLASGKHDVEFEGKGYRETRELAATLNYASHELARLDLLQKELIANISHDLRTPLTLIKGYSEIMRDLPGENTPENMQVVIDETTRLSELVSDLLDLSRIQAGAANVTPTAFNLTETVEEVMYRYDTLIKHKGFHVTFYADSVAWVMGDRGMLLQVVYNLINNAINYTGEDKCVEVRQTVTQNRVRISVTDTGKGIPPEEMPLIWDRYYKVDKVHRMAMIGTGLGLSIAKSILELHHAAYGASSTIGKGSTFWFELEIQSPLQEENDNIKQE